MPPKDNVKYGHGTLYFKNDLGEYQELGEVEELPPCFHDKQITPESPDIIH